MKLFNPQNVSYCNSFNLNFYIEMNHFGHNHDRYGLRIDFLKIKEDGQLSMRFLQREMFLRKKNRTRAINKQKR